MHSYIEKVFSLEKNFRQSLEEVLPSGLLFKELYLHLQNIHEISVQVKIMQLIDQFHATPFAKKSIRQQIEKVSGFAESYQPNGEELEKMDLVDLYAVRRSILDRDYRGLTSKAKAITEQLNVKMRVLDGVIRIGFALKKTANFQDATKVHANMASEVFDKMSAELSPMEIDYSEIDLEELNANPHIYFVNHQGGGLESYMATLIFNKGKLPPRPNSILVKDKLLHFPLFGDILKRLGTLGVNRSRLNNPEGRQAEIAKIGQMMRESLSDGRGIFLFPEGTRSADGNIAGSPKRIQWAQDLKAAVDETLVHHSAEQVLILVDTVLTMPTQIENLQQVFNDQGRVKAGIKIKFCRLPQNLPFQDNPENCYDTSNFFGFARSKLAEMQKAEIKKLLKLI